MQNKKIMALFVATIIVMTFTAVAGFSNSANCYTQTTSGTTAGTATNKATVGVASNFWGPVTDALLIDANNIQYSPALSMVKEYLEYLDSLVYTTPTAITVCHDSTGLLVQDASYDMIFGADQTMDSNNYSVSSPVPFVYAEGIPVFFGVRSSKGGYLSNVKSLITPPDDRWDNNPLKATISVNGNTGISGYSVNSTLTDANAEDSVAIAASTAPYGVAAYNILYDMDNVVLPSNPLPKWVHDPLFTNIGLTFDSVNNLSINSGWVAKSQICSGITGPNIADPRFVYVEFDSPAYTLEQVVGITKTAEGHSDNNLTVVEGLYDYIQDEMDGSNWNSFLTGFCYIAPQ